jgi:hypothetical protein
MQFATELIRQAELDFAAKVEAAAHVVIDDLITEYEDKRERILRAYTESFEHVELVAISELMKGSVLKIFANAMPADYALPDPGICLAAIQLSDAPFKLDGDRLVLSEPPLIGFGTREAARGRLARSFFFIGRDGEVIASGTCGAPEDSAADLRLARPAIKAGQKIVVAEFNVVMEE